MAVSPDIAKEREKKLSEAGREGEERATERKAQALGLPYLRVTVSSVDREHLYTIPRHDAERGEIIVLNRHDKNIRVAITDPENLETKRVIEQLKEQGFVAQPILVSRSSFRRALNEYDKVPPPPKVQEAGILSIGSGYKTKSLEDVKTRLVSLRGGEISQVLELFVGASLGLHASDIHIEPEDQRAMVRFRIDGVLQTVGAVEIPVYRLLLSRIKLLSGIQLNITDVPQDGRFSVQKDGHNIEVRSSILPGAYGEFIVLRVLDPYAIAFKIENLGLRPKLWEKIKPEIEKPNGIVLITGPTGSGKTTTLYAILKYLLKPEVKIITLEDPVEYHLEGISQSQIDPVHGYTFAEGLKNALRQDPDIILVGEIRDEETAQAALNAALTGHFVFTTLHTNDAPGAIPRFLDMNAKPKILASALNAVIAQRLVRTLCQECRQPIEVTDALFLKIKEGLRHDPEQAQKLRKNDMTIYKAVGCDECSNTGYRGRIGIFEVFVINESMEALIDTMPSRHAVLEEARKAEFLDMYHDGLLRVIEGITTIDEIERVALALG